MAQTPSQNLVTTHQEQHLLVITLNRPESHNAISAPMMDALTKIFKGINKDRNIRAVWIVGAGKSFCAGADFAWFQAGAKMSPVKNLNEARRLQNMYSTLLAIPVPVFAFLHGNVMGGGLGIAAACDFVAAETTTQFRFSEVRIGLVPSIISPFVLRKIPASFATRWMLTGRTFSSTEALESGLIQKTGSREECEGFLKEHLNQVLEAGPDAVRITKDLLRTLPYLNWSQQLSITAKTLAQRRASAEAVEGLTAFVEKRPPAWRPRGA